MTINSDNLPLLIMRGIVKKFATATALDGVNFDARSGEIHALLGENGAGKSTLMHVLSGLTPPNSGEVMLDGQTARLPTPRAARRAGIAMVHQHFTLVPAFTIEENLALDAAGDNGKPGKGMLSASRIALERAASLGWKLDARARVADLPVGTQQRVEIIKALATDARILIFDEPTAVLAGAEVEELFGVLRQLRGEGRTVILIAHKLAEIMAVADRVTILRRGKNVASTDVAQTNPVQLAEWMVGGLPAHSAHNNQSASSSAVSSNGIKPRADFSGGASDGDILIPPASPSADALPLQPAMPPAFVAADLTVRGDRGEIALRGLNLEVRAGEIVGIGGVDGNGQTELAEALVGLRSLESGALTWHDRPFQPGNAPCVGYIPQDRRRAGLAVTLSVEENLLFEAARDPAYRRGPFLQRKKLAALAADLIRAYDIRTQSGRIAVSSLSGGNQQKIVVARALYAAPPWIVAVNPTRGLDIGAARFVHAQLRKARANGAAIVLISTDLDELAALSDWQAILSGGVLSAYAGGAQDAAQIGLLLGGIAHTPHKAVETKP